MIVTNFSQDQALGVHKDFDGTPPNEGVRPDVKNGVHDREQKGQGVKGNANANVLDIITSYLGIIGVFTIITYYIEKMITSRRLKAKTML